MSISRNRLTTAPPLLMLMLLSTCLTVGCGRGTELSPEEQSYLDRVEGVPLPLRLSPSDLDTVMARAVDWIGRYSVYRIATRGGNFVQTEMPRSAAEGGIGYRVEANSFEDVLTVEILAARPDPFGDRSPVPDLTVTRMLGLYVRDGILPPNQTVGFVEGRR